MLEGRAARGEPRRTHVIQDFICLHLCLITCALARHMPNFRIEMCERVPEASVRGLETMSFGQDRSVRGQSADAKVLCAGIERAASTPEQDMEIARKSFCSYRRAIVIVTEPLW